MKAVEHVLFEMNGKNKLLALEAEAEFNGRLFPLSKKEAKKQNTKIGLLTDDDREFYVKSTSKWQAALWRHIWGYVKIRGTVNYMTRTLEIHSFQLGKFVFGVGGRATDLRVLSAA